MTFHITDEEVHDAFEVLRSQEGARCRAAYEYSEKKLKVVLARAQLAADGKTVGEREALALTSDDYAVALEAFRKVARAYHSARDAREAANAVIEAYRTQQSDLRAMGRVAA